MKHYLGNHPDIYPDLIRVHFINYGASSLDIRITCYARTGDHVKYLDVLNEINLTVLDLLQEAGVSCAFPSTSVYFETPLQSEAAPQPMPMPAAAPIKEEK